ncbi:carbohydrate kinase family protein [Microbulbifer thermotolerans]|uniref:carbohydrate kinase family protein n=1 Tax=Microbulbifer thermotolerans TaxID=252514 RepID=UPI00224B6C0E|nr:carbohydrate kinase [Microbulbifer thermotolerans]MCX2835467.1 carbohydrate kinase [Microbulbifer thermotolerans]
MVQPKVAVFGEALIDMIQQSTGEYQPYIGGSPYNVARSFVRQGLDCYYLSPISTDLMGEKILDSAREDGIKIPENYRSQRNTSLALVYKDHDGKPSYRLYRKGVADLDVTPEKLLDVLPPDIELFHTGSLALVPEMLDVLIPVIRELKTRGVKISIDVNVRKGVEENHHQYVAAIWRFVEFADIVKVSDEDLALKGLHGKPEFHAKAMLDRMDRGIVILTLGEGGSHLITQDFNFRQDVIEARDFKDTVGAGDTYFSALVAELLKGGALSPNAPEEILKRALRFGAAAASLNVSKVGCQPPTYAEVQKFMQTL